MGVLYASGHVDKLGLTKADGDALLVKPYRAEDAIRALRIVEQIVGTEAASRRFPRGFSVLDASPKGAARPDKADIEIARENKRLRQQQAQLAKFGSFALGEHDLGSVLMEAAVSAHNAWRSFTAQSIDTAMRKTNSSWMPG